MRNIEFSSKLIVFVSSCQRTMSLFDSIKLPIQIFQFSGFVPFSINKNTSKWELNPKLIVLSIIFIILYAALFFTSLILSDKIIKSDDSNLHTISFILLIASRYIQVLLALSEIFVKGYKYVHLLNAIENLDNLFKQHLKMHLDYKKIKSNCRFAIIAVITEFFSFLVFNVISFSQTKDSTRMHFIIMFLPAFTLSRFWYR